MTHDMDMQHGDHRATEAKTITEDGMRSTLVSRNITVLGRRTSVRLEPEMWAALRDIASREKCKIHDICSLIQVRKNPKTSLTAAIRVFLMLYYRAASTEEGHSRAGHGSYHMMMSRARVSRQDMVRRMNANRIPSSPDAIPLSP
jgi:predicted DNA-binding ribbon-helix-helix protein